VGGGGKWENGREGLNYTFPYYRTGATAILITNSLSLSVYESVSVYVSLSLSVSVSVSL